MVQTEKDQAAIDRTAMEIDAAHLAIMEKAKWCTSTICGSEWAVGYLFAEFVHCPECGSVLTDDIEKRGGQKK